MSHPSSRRSDRRARAQVSPLAPRPVRTTAVAAAAGDAARVVVSAFVAAVVTLLVALVTPAAHGQVVINEIDYDQEGTDAAEFIELYNTGALAVDLDDYSMELVNGSHGAPYQIFDLPEVPLAPGGYFVLCTDPVEIDPCDFVAGPPFNWLQNGAPDAVALLANGELVDTVSYEGETADPYTEGPMGAPADESAAGFASIARFPDGDDTDRNDLDFEPLCSTPGRLNAAEAPPCPVDEPLELTLSGDCPGAAVLTITGGSGGGTAVLLAGHGPGTEPLPGGPCAGQPSGLDGLRLVVSTPFDVNGNLVLERNLTPRQCRALLQAVDPTTCEMSGVEGW